MIPAKPNINHYATINHIKVKDKSGNIHAIPVLDIPLLSDEEWQKLCKNKTQASD